MNYYKGEQFYGRTTCILKHSLVTMHDMLKSLYELSQMAHQVGT